MLGQMWEARQEGVINLSHFGHDLILLKPLVLLLLEVEVLLALTGRKEGDPGNRQFGVL